MKNTEQRETSRCLTGLALVAALCAFLPIACGDGSGGDTNTDSDSDSDTETSTNSDSDTGSSEKVPPDCRENPVHKDGDIATLRMRLEEAYLEGASTDPKTYNAFLESQEKNGSWSDVDYKSTAITSWPPRTHLRRVEALVKAHALGLTLSISADALGAAIENAMVYWYSVNPVSDNWWFNDIGKQKHLTRIGILFDTHFSKETRNEIIGDLQAEIPSGWDGANLVDAANNVVVRGVMERDEARISNGMSGITWPIRLATGEGIQYDYSFHQHGPQLYNGGYGRVFLGVVTFFGNLVCNTQFEFTSNQVSILSDFVLEGNRWMTRGQTLDYGAEGRGISRPGLSTNATSETYLTRLIAMESNKETKDDLYPMIDNSVDGSRQDILGHRFFWRSDFACHHEEKFFSSVKMCSNRTRGTESINGENLKGFWLPFGTTYIYRTGTEYRQIFPLWDWAKIPGVTAPDVFMEPGYAIHHQVSFVGGVSNGRYGVTGMNLQEQQTTANKAWFHFGQELVALGSSINSTHASDVTTALNQSWLLGEVLADGVAVPAGIDTALQASWIHHDETAYVFQSETAINLSNDNVSGDWFDINTAGGSSIPANGDVFKLWIDHGNRPKDAAYVYMVVPGVTSIEAAAYAKNIPVTVLENNENIQSIRKGELAGAVFYSASNTSLEVSADIGITVNEPCILLYDNTGKKPTISVASPDRAASSIDVTITTSGSSVTETFEMPTGPYEGSSLTKTVSK